MTLVTAITSSLSVAIRAAVQRLSIGSVVVAATAFAALLYSWRERNNNNTTTTTNRRRRRRSNTNQTTTTSSSTTTSSTSTSTSPATSLPSWLSQVRTVTIGSKWTLSEPCDLFCKPSQQENSDSQQSNVILKPGVADQLKKFAKAFDLYFIVRVDSDQAEIDIKKILKENGLFLPGLLDERKVLFTETEIGRVSVARQLDPQFHIDESPTVVTDLQRFISMVALVTEDAQSISMAALGSNVTKFTSLSSVLT